MVAFINSSSRILFIWVIMASSSISYVDSSCFVIFETGIFLIMSLADCTIVDISKSFLKKTSAPDWLAQNLSRFLSRTVNIIKGISFVSLLLFKSLQVRESKDVSLNAQHDVGGLENRKTPLNLNTLLDSIPTPSKEDFEIFKLSDSEKFSLSIGKRVLNSELNPNATIPVYSANVKIPFGYIDKECLKEYESDSVLWGIDGDWMVGFMPRGRAFYPTDHCGILRVKDDSVNARILSFGLESEGKKAGFRREYRASLDRVADLKIPLPPLQVQQILVNLIEKLESKIEILQFSLSTLELKKHEILKKYL